MGSTQIASNGFISAAYVIAALLFIFSLAGLSKQESAQREIGRASCRERV